MVKLPRLEMNWNKPDQSFKESKAIKLPQLRTYLGIISQLHQIISSLESQIVELNQSLSSLRVENEQYSRQTEELRSKEEQLASVRITLQTQLQLLVTMTSHIND